MDGSLSRPAQDVIEVDVSKGQGKLQPYRKQRDGGNPLQP